MAGAQRINPLKTSSVGAGPRASPNSHKAVRVHRLSCSICFDLKDFCRAAALPFSVAHRRQLGKAQNYF